MDVAQVSRLESQRASFGEWLAASNYSPRTRPDYARYVRDFLNWLTQSTTITSALEVTPEQVQQYQLALCQQQPRGNQAWGGTLSISAQICRLSAVKTFFSWIVQTQQITRSPAALIETPEQPFRLPRTVLTQDEARRLLNSTPIHKPRDIRDRAIIEVLYATGIRRAELLGLTIYDADLQTATLRIERGKGGRTRLLPLTVGACAALKLYLSIARPRYAVATSNPALFISSRSGQPLSDNNVVRIVRKATKRAGISKHTTPHTLRLSCATHLLQERADIRLIQKLLGHKRLSTTEMFLTFIRCLTSFEVASGR